MGTTYTGCEVKAFIHGQGVKLWQVADVLGLTDGNFSKRLRKTFSDAEFRNIEQIVQKLNAEKDI